MSSLINLVEKATRRALATTKVIFIEIRILHPVLSMWLIGKDIIYHLLISITGDEKKARRSRRLRDTPKIARRAKRGNDEGECNTLGPFKESVAKEVKFNVGIKASADDSQEACAQAQEGSQLQDGKPWFAKRQ